MNDTLSGLNDAFLSLYRENILPVFRFHLARCGDWQEAQALTRETFRRAQPWFSRRVSASGQEVAWLFGIAVWVQSHIRRKVDVGDAAEDDMRPLQEQVAAFVTVSEISKTWSRLPVRTADALALFIFAGLDLDLAAQIVGWSSLDIRTRLARLVDQQTDQRLLASSLQPVGYFTGRLETELREMPQSRATARRRGAGPTFWHFSYVSSQAMGVAGRVIPLVFFVVLLLGAVWAITNRQFLRPVVILTPTIPPNLPASQFPWTDDAAILADEQGRVYRMQLFDQQKTYLSTRPGFYLPATQDTEILPQISPDGRWLELVSSLDQSTHLLALNGAENRTVTATPVQLSWARDSTAALFVDPAHPTILHRYSLPEDHDEILAVFSGTILSTAVAPDGRLAALLYQLPRLANAPQQNELVLVDMFTGQWNALARFQDPAALGSRHKLIWTDDGSEIWYPRYQMAVRLSNHALHPLVTTPPYDPTARPTFLNLLLHPSVAQPFLDRFGLEALMLDESDPHNYLLTLGAVAPDYSKVAMAYYNALGVTGSLALQQGPMLEDRAWSANFGMIGRIDWVQEGHELLVAEKANRPGRLWWVLARTGQRLELDQDVILLGTQSGLQRRSTNKAPQISLIPGLATSDGSSQMIVVHPGMGIRFSAPLGWKVWTYAEDRLWGSVAVANFDLQGPFGFASLGPDQLLVMLSPLAWQDQVPLRDWLDQLAQRSGGLASFTSTSVGGLPAYHLAYVLPDQGVEHMLLVESSRGVIGISMIPGNSKWVDEFDRILASIQFETTPYP